MTCQLCGAHCDDTVCPTCRSLAAAVNFGMLAANPNSFDARLEAMIAERGITDPDDPRVLVVFNEFLEQLRADGSYDEYTRQVIADMTNAGLMPLLTRVSNKRHDRRRKRGRRSA